MSWMGQVSRWIAVIGLAFVLSGALEASTGASHEAILPPVLPWQGRSETLVVPVTNPWITPAEKSGFETTPSYQETVDYLKRLCGASDRLRMISIGTSPQGRDIPMVIGCSDGQGAPEAFRAGQKPILLIQAGIHAGEIDGKDAGLMLLRDMTVLGTKQALLDRVNVLFVPFISVDGHERSSPYGRINQRGPQEMGWRTNARNLNLNRDYTKLDTPEMQALVRAINQWNPDLYLDIHVTDGVDYQYDITWGYNGTHAYSPGIVSWLDGRLTPALFKDLKAMGHIPGPLVFAVDNQDITQGIKQGTFSPRYSNGYGDIRHLPTVLIENHSLKPYRQRVLGTYVLIETCMRTLAEHHKDLRKAIEADQTRYASSLPVTWKDAEGPPGQTTFLGVTSELYNSIVTGRKQIRWTGQPVTLEIPLYLATRPNLEVARARAYWIDPAWSDVIARLEIHGIRMERFSKAQTVAVDMIRLSKLALAASAFEGHVRVTAELVSESRQQTFPPGSVRIPTDQPLGDLAVLLLEPGSPDSFFQWGFFHEVLQRTEYVEAYVMEPMAARMLAQDPDLMAMFTEKLMQDPDFAANPQARLQWFYRQTPFYDEQHGLYPVAREKQGPMSDGSKQGL